MGGVEAALASMEAIAENIKPAPGQVLGAWQNPVASCPEEDETPDPLSISEDVMSLAFM